MDVITYPCWGFKCVVLCFEYIVGSRPTENGSVTSGLRSVRLCTASASWCGINRWNVRQKLNPCLLRRHVHTKVNMITLGTVHDFIFHLSMISFTHFGDFATMKMAARATAARARDSKHQSNHRSTKPATGNQTLMWRHKWIINWYVGA